MTGTTEGGKKAAETIKEREGEDAMKKRGHEGGEARKQQGADYSELGSQGGKSSGGGKSQSREDKEER